MSSLQSGGGSEPKFKIGLVGESGVGKSCLLVRWVDDQFFTEDDKFTIGVDYKFKQITIKDKSIKLQIYDTAGQERFRTVTASFYRGAHGILLVFDLTQKDSFETRVEEWLKEIKSYTPDNTPIVLVGNKCDLKEKRAINYETAKAWADEHNLQYIETSAKDATNVNEAFTSLAEKIVDSKYASQPVVKKVDPSSNTGKGGSGKKSGCIVI